MKVGDMVKVRSQNGFGLVPETKKYPGHIGIITHITPQQPSAVGLLDRIHVMINNEMAIFLERYLEVLDETG